MLVHPEIGVVPEHASLAEIVALASAAKSQRVVALAGSAGLLSGLLELSAIEDAPATERHWMKAYDAKVPFVCVHDDAPWPEVARVLDRCGLTQVPVLSGNEIVGWVGDRELRRAVLDGFPEPGPPLGG
jgi:hypothetical protein